MALLVSQEGLKPAALPLNPLQKSKREEFLNWLGSDHRLERVECCAACSSQEFEALESHDRFGLPFGAQICRRCGLVSTSPRLKEEHLPEYYERFYTPLTMGAEGQDAPKFLVSSEQGKKIHAFVAHHFRSREQAVFEVGEIGCGPGGNLYEIRELFKLNNQVARVTGCEYSPYYVDYATNQLGITYVQGGPDDLIAQGVTFDLLVLSHVFEHMVDLQRAKDNIAKLLKPGGLVYIEVPGLLSFQQRPYYQSELRRFLTHAHVYNFALSSLVAVMQPEFELIAGNEDVQTLFRPRTGTLPSTNAYPGSYEPIVQHLAALRQQREAQAQQFCVAVSQMREAGRLLEAEAALEQLVYTFPDSLKLANLRAEIKFELGGTDEAKQILLSLAGDGAADEAVLNNLAVVLWASGDHQDALKYFKQAMDLDPGNRDTVINYGEALMALGAIDTAKQLYEEFLKMHPQDQEIAQLYTGLNGQG